MKKILITGADSYIGVSFENYIRQWEGRYQVDTLDMRESSWRTKDFSGYDVIFHVAGIAHSDTGKISREREALYYSVNTDLTVETAKKAKEEGVGQFVFMSSAIVYGESAGVGKEKMISKNTPVSPSNCYGDSKVRAENGILLLAEEGFKVAVLRAPMVYGRGSKGNYPLLSKFAKKMPIFPYVRNQRSMLYIENLLEFVRLVIEDEAQGIFWPQNAEYCGTSDLVKLIAGVKGKKILLVPGGGVLKLLSLVTGVVNKAFGNLTYEMKMSEYRKNYRVVSLEESIRRTEL